MFKKLWEKMMSASFVMALCIVALASADAWGQQPTPGGTLRIAVDSDLTRWMDARYMGVTSLFPSAYQVYEFLFSYGAKGVQEIVPGLMESWKGVDPQTYLLYLRKGVKFHNGREMTAEDVKENLDWALKTPSGWAPLRRRGFLVAVVDKAEIVDRYTLRLRLKAPFAPLVTMLRIVAQGIAPPEEVKKWGKDFTLHPSGTGPFKFVEQVPGDRMVLGRFEGYWGKKPYLDRVIFRTIPDEQSRLVALQTGEVDVARLDLASLPVVRKDPKLKTVVVTNRAIQGAVWFNLRNWPISSLKFRTAIAMGADWSKFPVATYGGVSTRIPLERSWAANPKAKELVPPYDPERARTLIKEVEAEAGRLIPPITFLVPFTYYTAQMGELAKTQLKKIGVELKLDVSPALVAAYQTGRWDMLLQVPSGPGSDPYFLLSLFTLAGEADMPDGKNRMGYVNPKIDELLKQAIAIEAPVRRARIYQEVEEIILRDLPAFYFYSPTYIFPMNAKVHDLAVLDDGGMYVTTPWNNTWTER